MPVLKTKKALFKFLVPVQKDLRLQGHWLCAPSICCLKDVKEVNKRVPGIQCTHFISSNS